MKAHEARERLLAGLPLTERRIDLAGISTAVYEGGEGPAMVLLHGPGEFAGKWAPVIPELTRTHRVIVPELPGHGESGTGEGELDADRILGWLAELVEHRCPSPPVLVGSVLGGAIAARFAAERGGQVERLVLTDSLGLGKFRPTPGFALALVRVQVRPTARSQAALMRQCFADVDAMRDRMGGSLEQIEAYALEHARDPDQKAALKSLMPKVGVPPIPPEQLERITAPTTLIWGRDDRAVKLRVAEAASARYGWPLHVIDDCGDDPAIEQPAAFVRALRTALRHDALEAVAS